jgi:hypothetical protein
MIKQYSGKKVIFGVKSDLKNSGKLIKALEEQTSCMVKTVYLAGDTKENLC